MVTSAKDCDLQGRGVLVTRPSGQAQALCDLIVQHGGKAIHFPTIVIEPAADQTAAKARLQNIADYQIVIFISSNAVEYGLELLGTTKLPAGTQVCAVGKGTALALSENGIEVDIKPDGRFDSESLLAQPELSDIAGMHILILRGNGGRELLADTLRQRGAKVDYAETYSRNIATADAAPLIAAWRKKVDIVTATSCEVLDNLFVLLGGEGGPMLCETPLAVVSDRIKVRAQELGCNSVILADEASDWGLLQAICAWADNK